eukprot:15451859-Alexandrium_andersonii.AAC.1
METAESSPSTLAAAPWAWISRRARSLSASVRVFVCVCVSVRVCAPVILGPCVCVSCRRSQSHGRPKAFGTLPTFRH